MTNYKIDITSDNVCPWCYVGWKRLSLAMQQQLAAHPEDTFTTEWHAFQLNPAMHTTVEKADYYAQKFGAARAKSMQAPLKQIGAQLGIDFMFEGKTGNTRDSHRLEVLAKTKGGNMQNKVFTGLAHAYFEENKDITDIDTLIDIGREAGLPGDEVKEWLMSDKGGAEVDAEVKSAQRQGITGVPNFTINGKYTIQGAEPPSEFLEVFNEISKSQV